MNEKTSREFSFEIVEHICTIAEGRQEGYTKELNYVAFNGKEPKWDIREWNADHTKMSKGLTFTEEEICKVAAAVGARFDLSANPDICSEEIV